MLKHVKQLRKNDFLTNSLVVVVIEANHPATTIDVVDELKRLKDPRMTFMMEAKGMGKEKTQPGIVTTAYSKDRMVNMMIDHLKHKKICFTEDFVWSAPGYNQLIQDLKGEFEREMRKFSKKKIVTRDHKNDVDRVHYTYSGKVIKENDDLPMATMLACYGKHLFFSAENRVKYGVYW